MLTLFLVMVSAYLVGATRRATGWSQRYWTLVLWLRARQLVRSAGLALGVLGYRVRDPVDASRPRGFFHSPVSLSDSTGWVRSSWSSSGWSDAPRRYTPLGIRHSMRDVIRSVSSV